MNVLPTWLERLIFLPGGEEPAPSFMQGDGTRLIFDHVRNFTIAALIGQVAIFICSLERGVKVWVYLTKGLGGTFFILALGLFALNFLHGDYLLSKSVYFQMIRFKWMIQKLYWSLYLISAFMACFYNVLLDLGKH